MCPHFFTSIRAIFLWRSKSRRAFQACLSIYQVPIKSNFSSLFVYASLPFATEFYNLQVVDFFEARKWLQNGSDLQQKIFMLDPVGSEGYVFDVRFFY